MGVKVKPSVMSTVERRVEALELDPGIIECKLSIYGCIHIIPMILPCPAFRNHVRDLIHSPTQTLTIQFNSILAMFNQLPCLGVYINSNRFQNLLADSG